MPERKTYDTIIVGGGFYGLRIAQFLKEELKVKRILVIEKEPGLMSRASYNNQARVHNGYHYPRSILTALRSRVNLPTFSKEFDTAIVDDFEKYYAVARTFSKVSAQQFQRFFERIEAEIEVDVNARKFFNSQLIEEVFQVREYAFNSTEIKKQLINKMGNLDIQINTNEKVNKFLPGNNLHTVTTEKDSYMAKRIINTTYSSINTINKNSGLPAVPLKHELAEMCLVQIPPELENKAFTLMCGPFFSLMPFPDRQDLYTLSHVRYTPHSEWHDSDKQVRDSHKYLEEIKPGTNFTKMLADVKRYMPSAQNIKYSGESLWEVKTVLPQSEGDDSRPIMYLDNYAGIKNYICIMGGKLDNIYDVFRELKESYA